MPKEKSNAFVLKAVKTVVVRLNKLNDQCDGVLIETGRREQLCALLIAAAQRAGLVSDEYDVTAPWREW
ncbi:hypothetical protein [Frigoriglobus tundricola]|uniref:hypothetical protein n=1 Tax=Frigoriglobus tundricola TaxID=2774151 RepID=UPI00148ED791|nr:hypothetical protein [Frigoriglobus tundricola]